MSKYFNIEGISYPGRVALIRMGEVRLYELPDEVLLDIYNNGLCDYIKLTPEGYEKYFPGKAPIEVKEINQVIKKTVKKPAAKSAASS